MKKITYIFSVFVTLSCQKVNISDSNDNILKTKEAYLRDSLEKVNAIKDPGTNIEIFAEDKTTINTDIFGINNDWAQITNVEYPSFAKANDLNGYKIIRYPGGFESEYYNWLTNETPNWKNTPTIVGATSSTMKAHSNNFGIVIPIQAAMLKSINSKDFENALNELKLVTEASINSVGANNTKIVEIGNEWWLHHAGGVSRPEKLSKYAKIAMSLAEHIQLKYPNRKFKLLINGDYSIPEEFTKLRNQFTTSYNVIDGVALHPYTGYDIADGHNIGGLEANLKACAHNWNPNKKYIYCSEWAPSKLYNGNKTYMEAANIIPDIIHIFARSNVNAGAYWPPTNPSIVGLGLYDESFKPYPCGQIYADMARNYVGEALKTSSNSNLKASVALQNANSMILYVSGNNIDSKTASIKVNGFIMKSITQAIKLRPENYNQTNKDSPYIEEKTPVKLDKLQNKLIFEVNKEGKYQIFKIVVNS